jgi:hypothetical protein
VLFAALQGSEAFYRPPYHQLRHPMIFYYGHPAVLYVNKFRVAGLLQDGLDPLLEQVSSPLSGASGTAGCCAGQRRSSARRTWGRQHCQGRAASSLQQHQPRLTLPCMPSAVCQCPVCAMSLACSSTKRLAGPCMR